MRKYKSLIEDVYFKNDTWSEVEIKDLSDEQLKKLWDTYVHSYKDIGLSVKSLRDLTQKYRIAWMIDIDRNNLPDAFIIYKVTKFGNKLALLGSKGTPESKKIVINKSIQLLKSGKYYAEVSHKLKDIFDKNNLPRIDDEEVVKNLLEPKSDITWYGNGEYERYLSGVGKVKKVMFGTLR